MQRERFNINEEHLQNVLSVKRQMHGKLNNQIFNFRIEQSKMNNDEIIKRAKANRHEEYKGVFERY